MLSLRLFSRIPRVSVCMTSGFGGEVPGFSNFGQSQENGTKEEEKEEDYVSSGC